MWTEYKTELLRYNEVKAHSDRLLDPKCQISTLLFELNIELED